MQAETASEAFIETLDDLIQYPDAVVSPRGQKTAEMLDYHVVIQRPQAIIAATGREWKYAIGAAEAMALVGQVSVPEVLTDRFKAWSPFIDDGVLWGAYGPRIAGDLGQVVKTLQADPDSRQAVLTIFDSGRDLNRGVKDVPCTIAIQFLLRDELFMRVMMRSNDIWLGFPYDTMQFAALQSAVATALGVEMGEYSHLAGSMHLYERDRDKAMQIVSGKSITFDEMWSPMVTDIGEISQRARSILLKPWAALEYETEWESWMRSQLS